MGQRHGGNLCPVHGVEFTYTCPLCEREMVSALHAKEVSRPTYGEAVEADVYGRVVLGRDGRKPAHIGEDW